MPKQFDLEEVIEVAKIDPHAYRHEWGTSALNLLIESARAGRKCAGLLDYLSTETDCMTGFHLNGDLLSWNEVLIDWVDGECDEISGKGCSVPTSKEISLAAFGERSE